MIAMRVLVRVRRSRIGLVDWKGMCVCCVLCWVLWCAVCGSLEVVGVGCFGSLGAWEFDNRNDWRAEEDWKLLLLWEWIQTREMSM